MTGEHTDAVDGTAVSDYDLELSDHDIEIIRKARRSLRDLSDDQLKAGCDLVSDATKQAFKGGSEELAWYVFVQLADLNGEWNRRAELLERARIAVEANGHEVTVDFDDVAADRYGAGWEVLCSCSDYQLGGYLATEDEARAAAGSHAADHGGRWRD